tara:strand:- start:1407 stop:1724 length:318 start_codon:yes stop_codon:yes gene_type:complete
MALKQIGPNQTQITYSDGSEVFWSYETPVAGKLPDGTYVRTATKWSTTTSRHINRWLDGVNAVEVPQDTFTDIVIIMEMNQISLMEMNQIYVTDCAMAWENLLTA